MNADSLIRFMVSKIPVKGLSTKTALKSGKSIAKPFKIYQFAH